MGKTVKKILKLTISTIVGIIILITISFQINFEKEILFQKEEYNLLENKRRLKYTPVVIYLIKTRFFNKEIVDTQSFNLVYENVDEKTIMRYPKSDQQKYILHCYYTEDEKNEYIEKLK